MTYAPTVEPVRPPAAVCRGIEIIQGASAYAQYRCAPPDDLRRLGLHTERFGSATLILTRTSESTTKNRLIAIGQASPATTAQIDRAVERARAHRCKVLAVLLGGSARPRRLADWLRRRGFRRRSPVAKLWRDDASLSGPSAPRDVSIRRVGRGEAGLWVDVVSDVWPTIGFRRSWYEARARAPGWRHYIAWIDDQPAGAGSLFVGDAGRVRAGHLYEGATLKRWRRRGVQRALIRKRISDGRRLGCELFTSETAPPLPRMPLVSFRNLRRQGFELAYLQQVWQLVL